MFHSQASTDEIGKKIFVTLLVPPSRVRVVFPTARSSLAWVQPSWVHPVRRVSVITTAIRYCHNRLASFPAHICPSGAGEGKRGALQYLGIDLVQLILNFGEGSKIGR